MLLCVEELAKMIFYEGGSTRTFISNVKLT